MSANQDGVQGSEGQDTLQGEQAQETVVAVTGEDTIAGAAQEEESSAVVEEKKDEPVAAVQPPPPPVTPTPTPPPAAKETKPELKVVAQETVSIEAFLAKKHPNQPIAPGVQQVIDRLQKYQDNMGENQPIAPEDGARHQVNLFRTITTALDLNGYENLMAMDAIVYFFRTFKNGAYNESRLMRFMDRIQLDKNQSLLLQMLFVLFANSAKENGMVHVKKVTDFRQIQKFMKSAGHQEKLLAYFSR